MTKIINELLHAVTYKDVFIEEEPKPTENERSEVAPSSSKQFDKNAVWTCSKCFVQIKQKKNVPRHQRNCLPVKVKVSTPRPRPKTAAVFKCDLCEAQFSLQKSLTAHAKKNHIEQYCLENKETLFSCSQCNFKSIADRYLKAHVKKFHMPKGNFSCDFCKNKYANKDSLRVHVKSVHLISKWSYICEVCGCIIVPSSEEETHACLVRNQVPLVRHGYENQQNAVNTHSQISGFNSNFPMNQNQEILRGQDPWQFSQVGASGWQHFQFGTDLPWHHSQGQLYGHLQHSPVQLDGNWQHSQVQLDGSWQHSQAQLDGNWQHSQAQVERNWQHSQARTNSSLQHFQAITDGSLPHSQMSNWASQHPTAMIDGAGMNFQAVDNNLLNSQAKTDKDLQHSEDRTDGSSAGQHPPTSIEWTWSHSRARAEGDLQQAEVHGEKQHSQDITDGGPGQYFQEAGTSRDSSHIRGISVVDGRKFLNL